MSELQSGAAIEDRALGTKLRVVVTDATCLHVASAAVDGVMRAVDWSCSRFRDDSELARLNASAGRAFRVSPLLGRAIEEALRAARVTGGAVDPTVGEAIRNAGYDVDFLAIPQDGGPVTVSARPVPGWRMVRYEPVSRTVSTPQGVELDLGATAKALAADLAAAAALQSLAGQGGVLVSLGGDIAVAGAPPPGGWTVQVSEDSAAPVDEAAERVTLRSGGIASSSTRVRRWRRGGVEMHHIIDPRTGAPAETPWRLATVVAGTCVDANTASTAAIVMGAGAPAWLAGRNLPARLVDCDGTVHRAGGWPQPV